VNERCAEEFSINTELITTRRDRNIDSNFTFGGSPAVIDPLAHAETRSFGHMFNREIAG
jgi:hypothetical protein